MSEFKNPFSKGDILWWERKGAPIAFYYVSVNDTICSMDGLLSASIEKLVRYYRDDSEVDGPYRLAQSENWSAYNFGL